MSIERSQPLFSVGEVAILQPPHSSAKAYWGMETTILSRVWSDSHEDAFAENSAGWSYGTDIPAPPPSSEPRHQHMRWIWSEYDLRKKLDPGMEFDELMSELHTPLHIFDVEVV